MSCQRSGTIEADTATWSFAYDREFFGHPVIEVEAPEGSTLDVAYDDWQRSDGCVNLFGSNPYTNTADRFFLRGGRQKIEVLNPRGGIHIQVTLRSSETGESSKLQVHDIYVRRKTLINEAEVQGVLSRENQTLTMLGRLL